MGLPTFPDFNVTGAVHHWVQMPGQSNPLYLGTAEVTPKVHFDVKWRDAFNDIAGKELPAQRTKQGRSAVIGVLLNRYSKAAWGEILLVGQSAGVQLDFGQEARFSRGSLAFGTSTFKLWQVFDNATDANFRQTGMELGYYWPQVMIGGEDRDTLGTEIEKLMLVFEAYPYFVPQANPTSVSGTERSWLLFSLNDADFPQTVLVPQ